MKLGRTVTTKEAFIDNVKKHLRKMKDGEYVQVYGVYDTIEKASEVQQKYRSAIHSYVSNNSFGLFQMQGDGLSYEGEGYFLFRLTKTGTYNQKFKMPEPEVFDWIKMIDEHKEQDGKTVLPLHGTVPDIDAFQTIFDVSFEGELTYWNMETEEEVQRPTQANFHAAGAFTI